MTIRMETERPALRVIDGGRSRGEPALGPLSLPAPPDPGPAELAAEMAELYALSLVRDVPFAAMSDPHHAIWVDGATRFTLHELLCELRSLSWFDGPTPPTGAAVPVSASRSRAGTGGEAGHRRALRLNGDGQLTLRSLFRGPLAHGCPENTVSRLHAIRCDDPEACVPPRPSEDAPMSHWVEHLRAGTGAALTLPGLPGQGAPALATPLALMAHLRGAHPSRAHFAAALACLARGTPFDPGLDRIGGPAPMTAQQLLALMARTADRAAACALSQVGRRDRISRPDVHAARFTVLQAHRPKLMAGRGETPLEAAFEDLARGAPNLLHWIARRNAADGRSGRFDEVLLLPASGTGAPAPHRNDAATQVAIAGALSTVLKALFDTARPAGPRPLHLAAGALDIAAEADRLAADIALARAASGGWFQAENHQDLRLGEALALQTLRAWIETTGDTLSLDFTDFDGRAVALSAQARATGHSHATLRIDGRLAPWPLEASRNGAHLEVV
ncbi:hypothetical protein [Salipiger mucosus]|uniref:Bromoperoxidase n=1 Tax=Salipiger mucosus DSM 16094 TaxID=1123237 RepID=S9QDY4_9RHOB|nr:hypothetical protein [Salipiger mucosus]EPX79631.1 hypothetical protein Salmuc_05571 [Salipiger mucosus DSM 16094]